MGHRSSPRCLAAVPELRGDRVLLGFGSKVGGWATAPGPFPGGRLDLVVPGGAGAVGGRRLPDSQRTIAYGIAQPSVESRLSPPSPPRAVRGAGCRSVCRGWPGGRWACWCWCCRAAAGLVVHDRWAAAFRRRLLLLDAGVSPPRASSPPPGGRPALWSGPHARAQSRPHASRAARPSLPARWSVSTLGSPLLRRFARVPPGEPTRPAPSSEPRACGR